MKTGTDLRGTHSKVHRKPDLRIEEVQDLDEELIELLGSENRNWMSLTVDFLAMTNLDDTDNQTHIGYRIDDPIRTLANAILIILPGKFFAAGRSRIGGKILDALDDAETVFLGG